jgi:hypothetical protein
MYRIVTGNYPLVTNLARGLLRWEKEGIKGELRRLEVQYRYATQTDRY